MEGQSSGRQNRPNPVCLHKEISDRSMPLLQQDKG